MSHLDNLFADLPAILNVSQTAKVLGIQRSTVYKWLNEGVLPGYKVGSAWVILRDEVRDTIRSGRNLTDPSHGELSREGDGP
jgi:excisionase family DNA binding protein